MSAPASRDRARLPASRPEPSASGRRCDAGRPASFPDSSGSSAACTVAGSRPGGFSLLRRAAVLLAALVAFAAPMETLAQAKPTVSIHRDTFAAQAEEARRSYTFTIKAVDGQGNAFSFSGTPPSVKVDIAQSGHFVSSGDLGERTVALVDNGDATFTVSLVQDRVDEPNGTLTATLLAGADYDLDASAK
ncbi:MAG: hypothetical protein F4103_07660, partial [Boseongicola sp. SB0673_bin_14]|nr:hypothetical protein [Boseongicola sp. SB0673_bin_14]